MFILVDMLYCIISLFEAIFLYLKKKMSFLLDKKLNLSILTAESKFDVFPSECSRQVKYRGHSEGNRSLYVPYKEER